MASHYDIKVSYGMYIGRNTEPRMEVKRKRLILSFEIR